LSHLGIRHLGWLLPLFVLGCAIEGLEAAPPREPVRWLLVERRYADVAPTGSGDGRINPDATVLAFQPLYPEDLSWEVVIDTEEHYVEVVGFSPAGQARPGEIVSATVRVGKAKAGQLYRLSAKASQADIRILGESQATVKGSDTAVFRFTSCASGRAGIAVGVERIGP
jgi:hypothetical protein